MDPKRLIAWSQICTPFRRQTGKTYPKWRKHREILTLLTTISAENTPIFMKMAIEIKKHPYFKESVDAAEELKTDPFRRFLGTRMSSTSCGEWPPRANTVYEYRCIYKKFALHLYNKKIKNKNKINRIKK